MNANSIWIIASVALPALLVAVYMYVRHRMDRSAGIASGHGHEAERTATMPTDSFGREVQVQVEVTWWQAGSATGYIQREPFSAGLQPLSFHPRQPMPMLFLAYPSPPPAGSRVTVDVLCKIDDDWRLVERVGLSEEDGYELAHELRANPLAPRLRVLNSGVVVAVPDLASQVKTILHH